VPPQALPNEQTVAMAQITGKGEGVHWRWLLALALGCLGLPFVDVLYAAVARDNHATTSLAHLQWGLVLAVAMLAHRPIYLRTLLPLCYVGWIFRSGWETNGNIQAMLDHAKIMLPIYVLMYGGTVLCVRMMGWPRAGIHRHFRQRDMPAFILISLLLYPLGWLCSFVLTSGTHYWYPQDFVGQASYLFFSRYYGVVLLTLPIVLLATGWREPAATPARISVVERVMVGVYTLLFLWLLNVPQQHQDLANRILDHRFLMAALMVWLSLRLPWRWCVPLMALMSTVLLVCIAQSNHLDPDFSQQRMALHAIELAMIQQICVLVLLIGRNRRRAMQRVAEAALVDGLTGVPNINALRRDLASREQVPEELGLLSIEHVDTLMASFGLPAQEALTSALHARLQPSLDAYIMGPGRFILVPRTGHAVSWNEVLLVMENFEFRYADTCLRMEPHLGVAALAGRDDPALDAALHAAFRAKRMARQRAETSPVFADTLESGEAGRLAFKTHSLALSLLRQNAVELHVQPIRRIGQQTGAEMAEVLCRLRGPDGMLMPADYMEELEASRGVVELDRAVIENMLAWMQAHPDNGGYQRLAVNLTGRSLVSEHFRDWLLHKLDSFPGAPGRLCFEVTERAIEGGIIRATPLLQSLHQRGCKIALDDFGTGMQSFDRLQQLPIDLVKIDGAFVRNILSNARDRELVRAMVTIANAYQAETVAEYVENEQLLRLLQELGVDWAQGHYIARPAKLLP
jgi:EAL domain-containing protein (putative c-di-GMP-specific phosphodiesterase class I)/GGDEF domain-containing protein